MVATDNRPPPIIRVGPSNSTLTLDGVALLPCEASGHPAPKIKWLRDGVNVDNDQRVTILDSGMLQISGEFHFTDLSLLLTFEMEIGSFLKHLVDLLLYSKTM